MGRKWLFILSVTLCLLAGGNRAAAQFRSEAFSQNYSDDPQAQESDGARRDSSFTFSISEYFGGLLHKRTSRMGNTFLGSMVFVGGQQIYNRDY